MTIGAMEDERAPIGLLIAAVGAAVLAISVFLPWYGLSITPMGAATAQQELATIGRQFGNTTLQAAAKRAEAQFGSMTGRQLATVSAHQDLRNVSLILLGIAGVALLASLLRLADMRGMFYAKGSQIALLGFVAAFVVIFRIVLRPGESGLISLSLSPGIWLALLSAGAVAAGGLFAGSSRTNMRARPKVGPGPPPLGHDVASPNAMARPRP